MSTSKRSVFRYPWPVLGGSLAFAALLAIWLPGPGTTQANAVPGEAADRMFLTDEPGNWFRSEANGIPLSIVKVGDKVNFRVDGDETDTIHTATLLLAPPGSTVSLDQEKPFKGGGESIVFDVPGVYLFICKVHPYMAGAVAVLDELGDDPLGKALALEVPVDELPFIQHLGLGVDSLPLSVVVQVLTVVAPIDDDPTLGALLGKAQKWDIFSSSADFRPTDSGGEPGVGEVWVDSQFERVNGQRKPGTITVVNVGDTDGVPFTVEREVDGRGVFEWNNPHNMWANFEHDVIYNSNWFGRWVNKIDRATGEILDSVEVGFSPTHIITNPNPASDEFGFLHIPLSAEDDIVRVEDQGNRLHVVDSNPTGAGRNHPHGHWLQCGTGALTVMPNVFKGLGFAGSISVIDTEEGNVVKEFLFDPNDQFQSTLLMPLAAGECHVEGMSKAYVGNVVTGTVTVIDLNDAADVKITKNICITLLPGTSQAQIDALIAGPGEGNGCDVGGFAGPAVPLFHTLQLPIQTPVSPDGKWVATAVFSLINLDGTLGLERSAVGTDDHVAIIDTSTDKVVAFLPSPAGTHGINWGAKKGGGYYAYVTAQHANVLTVIDPEPSPPSTVCILGPMDGRACVVGQISLAVTDPNGAGATNGTGGQGVKPLPMVHDGWIQPAVGLVGSGRLSAEVEGWINQLTAEQQNPVN